MANLLTKRLAESLRTSDFPNPALLELYRNPAVSQRRPPRNRKGPNISVLASFAKWKLGWEGDNGSNRFLMSLAPGFALWNILHPTMSPTPASDVPQTPSCTVVNSLKATIPDYFTHLSSPARRPRKTSFSFIEFKTSTQADRAPSKVCFDPHDLMSEIQTVFGKDLPRIYKVSIAHEYAVAGKRMTFKEGQRGLETEQLCQSGGMFICLAIFLM